MWRFRRWQGDIMEIQFHRVYQFNSSRIKPSKNTQQTATLLMSITFFGQGQNASHIWIKYWTNFRNKLKTILLNPTNRSQPYQFNGMNRFFSMFLILLRSMQSLRVLMISLMTQILHFTTFGGPMAHKDLLAIFDFKQHNEFIPYKRHLWLRQ